MTGSKGCTAAGPTRKYALNRSRPTNLLYREVLLAMIQTARHVFIQIDSSPKWVRECEVPRINYGENSMFCCATG